MGNFSTEYGWSGMMGQWGTTGIIIGWLWMVLVWVLVIIAIVALWRWLASAKVPVFDVASRYGELGEALMPLINPVVAAKYGLQITSFIIENVSVPPEVEQAIDKRSSMAAVGNLNDYVKFQMAQGMEKGGSSGGMATELAVGLSIAQQIMRDQGMPSAAAAGAAPASAVSVDLLSPADAAKALGVDEADVMAIISSGELAAKKIGASYRIKRSALDEYLSK